MELHVVILAAGSGKRMASGQPKVLHELGGKPLLSHVIRTAKKLNAQMLHVIYGNGGSNFPELFASYDVDWIKQEQQLGTGHAVTQALPKLADQDRVLVLYGDVPLISSATLKRLLTNTPQNGLGILVTELEDPSGFGRIIRNRLGEIIAIVEDKDASKKQREIREINTGIITAPARHLKEWLPKLKNQNKQQEYYLTDVIALAVQSGVPIVGVKAASCEEVKGVNDRWQLSQLERSYQKQLAKQFAINGVTIMDYNRLDIRGNVTIEPDATIDVNVVLEGNVKIGAHSKIGPNVFIKNSQIGENVEIKANSVVEGAIIADHCQVGPFARLRPETQLSQGAKIGNFVEVKKSKIGADTKISHLSYIGDADIGSGVNLGASTVTVNYDGANKWKTTIKDGAFVGCHSSLIAPVTIGTNAYIGAGSVISKDAPDNELTLARATQTTIKGWASPRDKVSEKA